MNETWPEGPTEKAPTIEEIVEAIPEHLQQRWLQQILDGPEIHICGTDADGNHYCGY